MDDLISDFVADTRETFDRVRTDLAVWEADPEDRAALDALFRFVHTVHGNCGFINFERFERLSGPAEQLLHDLRDGRRASDQQTVAALAVVLRRIGALAEAIEAGVGLAATDEPGLVAALGVSLPEAPKIQIAPQPRAAQKARTIRLSVDQFDALAQALEAVEAAHRHLLTAISSTTLEGQAGAAISALSAAVRSAGDAVTLSRKQPLERLFAGLDRLVSQTGRTLGKQVHLVTHGGDLLVNVDVIDGLRDSFVHLIRNAIDHGLESPEDRRAAGKAEWGTVRIDAVRSADGLRLDLSDDGRGIDAAKIAGSDDLLHVLTRPGFSTKVQAGPVSGRGVGLDVVRNQVEHLGAQLSLETAPGTGSRFSIFVSETKALAHAA